jgi:hypothetical protein
MGVHDFLRATARATHEQRVPALNAANVWMMRAAAKLRARLGDAARSAELGRQADAFARKWLTS